MPVNMNMSKEAIIRKYNEDLESMAQSEKRQRENFIQAEKDLKAEKQKNEEMQRKFHNAMVRNSEEIGDLKSENNYLQEENEDLKKAIRTIGRML